MNRPAFLDVLRFVYGCDLTKSPVVPFCFDSSDESAGKTLKDKGWEHCILVLGLSQKYALEELEVLKS